MGIIHHTNRLSQGAKTFLFLLFIIIEFTSVLSLVHIRYYSVILFYLGLGGLIFVYIKEKKEKRKNRKGNLLAQLILNLKGEAGSWTGIITVIFVIININILSNIIWDTKEIVKNINLSGYLIQLRDGKIDYWMLNTWGIFITQILLIGFFLIIPFYMFPILSIKESENPKVLISALSLLTDFGKSPADMDAVRKKLLSLDTNKQYDKSFYDSAPSISSPKEFEYFNFNHSSVNWGKWNVIRFSLIEHSSIEKIILIASPEIIQLKDTINKLILEDELKYFQNFDLEKLIQTYYPERQIKVVYSNPIDFNDFHDVKSKLQTAISENAIDVGYSDCDLLFNITLGTAQVTASMILSALKGDRKAEYIHQNTGKVIPVDVDVLTIQDLWDEIGLKIQKNKL